ncbi:rhamnogalacturonidase [Saccharicrinis fermentans]|uniref:Exo-poly-alpha-D-galacturonosidase n=1 Tax=Saccharicrinis fermentans DSM 9555 = JCM 21142 TaxID=869213 RepID=W7XVI4_9BACT|nr:glycoside hydrolase family 28 protein [Saccharicrinis fermentans]GAF02120.1 exo-poly-alpha-D-galacturonosidase precursor [Saccharicrinis fermentans DSM 9555 = JCM 21142]
MRLLLVFTAFIQGLFLQAEIYNIKDFGAIGDGVAIDSWAINKAIDEAAKNGGGTIYFPAGTYACYSIRLKSNLTLHIGSGATILAAFPTEKKGYDQAEPNMDNLFQDFGHSHWKNSLLWAIGERNINICGNGLINGEGLTREESRLPGVGNKALSFKECKNVTVKDISMLNCGHFAVLATGVDNLHIINVKADTDRDGFDIDCCRNVRISGCTVNCPWDDAIVLKASYGLGYFKDTENVIIDGCFVSGYDMGSVLNGKWETNEAVAPDHGPNTGRIKLGTESSGGFKNIVISNCIFERSRGLAIESVDGGWLQDVVVSNITMRDVGNAPFFIRLGGRQRSPIGTPIGKLQRLQISNVNVFNADSNFSNIISGIPGHRIEEVSFSNIHIHFKGGVKISDVDDVIPENIKKYPEPWMFGVVPASGFFVRHVQDVIFENIRFYFDSYDERPLFVLEDAESVDIFKVRVGGVLVENPCALPSRKCK